jgi:hypothetical protein
LVTERSEEPENPKSQEGNIHEVPISVHGPVPSLSMHQTLLVALFPFKISLQLKDKDAVGRHKRCAVPWLKQLVTGLSPQRPEFDLRLVHVVFVVDKVALGQVFSKYVSFPVSITPPMLCTHPSIHPSIHPSWPLYN